MHFLHVLYILSLSFRPSVSQTKMRIVIALATKVYGKKERVRRVKRVHDGEIENNKG